MFTPTLSYHPAELESYAYDATLGSDIFTNGMESEMNYDHQRTKMTHTYNGILQYQKTYVGNCEFWNGNLFGPAKSLTYLSGPTGVFAVAESAGDDFAIHYIYKDHLGSWTTITDAEGNLEQEASFDAWGNIRSASDWTSPMNEKLLFDRGYTGHEHLYFYGRMPGSNPSTDLSLINMNGRMYDPVMSSFLSVDNYVQSPENSQNFNRYAYCLNNPLKYTDPDGEFFWLVPNIGYSKEGGLSFGLTAAVGLPGLWSAQASLGYSVGSKSIYGSAGVTFVGITGYVSAGYSFKNEQAFASIGITAGLSPYSGVPVSTNFLTVGGSLDFTSSKTGGADWSLTGNLSAWSYNTSAKGWNFNPSVSVMVYPEHTTNLMRGQGFRSNDAVLRRFVAANNHQGALDYFGFEGKYDPNKASVTSPGSDYWGATNRTTGDISYGNLAFENYATLYETYIKESSTSQRIKSGLSIHEVPEEFQGLPIETYLEEIDGYIYAYKNQGLFFSVFSKESLPFQGIEYYQSQLRLLGIPYPEYPKYFGWLYKIPRKW